MKRGKISTIILCLLLFSATFAVAEQYTQIGIIDFSKIISHYFRESKAYRELEEMKNEYEENRQRIMEEIDQLESRKIRAENRGDEQEVLELDNQIFEKKEYLKEYSRIKYNQIKKKQESLLQSSSFLSEIIKEIEYVAENEGYSIVLRAQDADLMWWSPEVDITDMVLERLRQTSR
jgi:outer membrane protein